MSTESSLTSKKPGFGHFFVVGVQRSGTTYLHRILDEHPEIEMAKPVRPEPKFFMNDALYGEGIDFYYGRFFEPESGAWLLGEKSTSYAESERAARRIATHFPEGKIVFLLRDPIERAISNYYFSLGHGVETLPIEEAFLREEERWRDFDRERISVSPFAYKRRGRYIENIAMYGRYFSAEQIGIFLQERLLGSVSEVQALYSFLGVSEFVPPSLFEQINSGRKPVQVAISEETRLALVEYYAEPNYQLSQRFGLDLSCWKNFEATGVGMALHGSVEEG